MKSPLETAGVPNFPFTFRCSKLAYYKTDYFIYVAWYRTTTSSDPGSPNGGAATSIQITNLNGITCPMMFTTTFSSGSNTVEEIVIPLSCSSIAFTGATYGGEFGDFTASAAP